MKIRDRENRKILTGFWDMADFVTGHWDPIPPLVAPLVLPTYHLLMTDEITFILY